MSRASSLSHALGSRTVFSECLFALARFRM